MIEQALLNMYGSNVQPIQDFFRGNVRAPAVRDRFAETFAAHGGNFDQPVRIDYFCP